MYKKSLLLFLVFHFFIKAQTSQQIEQAKSIIKKTGMSESQAKSIAKSKGFSDQQINTVIEKERLKTVSSNQEQPDQSQMQNKDIQENSNEFKEQNNADDELVVIDENEDLNIESKLEPNKQALKYFGYDIFESDPSLFQSTSVGAVDPSYLIGPGDEIIVMLWGETQFRQVLTVNREGFIFIPEIGQVFVNGLNLNLLESKLYKVLSQSYASLNPQSREATTFLDVSIGNLRPLRIQVLGEVARPGAYTVSPSATLFSSLYYFNGPTTLGSLRDVRLIRNGKIIASIDFYDYLLTGKKPQDEKLILDDVIFIPQRLKTISVFGEVKRPGIYELKEKEYLKDLILISGGLKTTAYLDRAQIDRIVPFEKRSELGMDRLYTDVSLTEVINSDSNFVLNDADKIEVFSVMDLRQNIVTIRGSVSRPGDYDIGQGLTLSELIIKSDSLLGDAYSDRVDVVRVMPDFTEKLIKLNLVKSLNNHPEHDITLQGLDRVKVYSITEMVPKNFVSIRGHAKNPGKYYLYEDMTLYDLLFKAGGYFDEQYLKKTYLKRAELFRVRSEKELKDIIPFDLELVLNKEGLADSLLKPNDEIRVYSVEEIEGDKRYVSLKGYVKRPGKYELFQGNMTLYDLLFKAGGFEDPIFLANAYRERADLIRNQDYQISPKIISFNLDNVREDPKSEENILLKPGDVVKVYSKKVFNDVRNVTISGMINNPGTYTYKDQMSLKDLILESGGVNKDIFRYKIEIARVDPRVLDDNTMAESFVLDMRNDYSISSSENLFNVNEDSNFMLMPYDHVFIRPDPYFGMQKKVYVTGQVYYPGEYAILNTNETIYDIINRAGGIKPRAYEIASQFTRDGKNIIIDIGKILKKPKSKMNLKVQDNDQIFIASKPDMIRVVGEVSSPGFYNYSKGLRIRNVINEAGGFTPDANFENIFIKFPNGKSKQYNRFLSNPKVLDGSIITVGKKPESEPLDKTEFLKEISTIVGNFIQAISIIIIAQGQAS